MVSFFQPLYGDEQSCLEFNTEVEAFILDFGFAEQFQQLKDRFDEDLGFASTEGMPEETITAIRSDQLARCLFIRDYYEQAFQLVGNRLIEQLDELTLRVEKITLLEEKRQESGEMDYYDYLKKEYNIIVK